MQPKFETIIDYCKSKNIQLTNQRSLIIRIIATTPDQLTANEILYLIG